MAEEIINLGTNANDGTGDKLRIAFTKVDHNFDELYATDRNTANSIGILSNNTNQLANAVNNVSSELESAYGVANASYNKANNIFSNDIHTLNVLPLQANTYSLGSPELQWKSLYVSGNTIFMDNTPLSMGSNGTFTSHGNIKINNTNGRLLDVLDRPLINPNALDINLDGGTSIAVFSVTDNHFDGGAVSKAGELAQKGVEAVGGTIDPNKNNIDLYDERYLEFLKLCEPVSLRIPLRRSLMPLLTCVADAACVSLSFLAIFSPFIFSWLLYHSCHSKYLSFNR